MKNIIAVAISGEFPQRFTEFTTTRHQFRKDYSLGLCEAGDLEVEKYFLDLTYLSRSQVMQVVEAFTDVVDNKKFYDGYSLEFCGEAIITCRVYTQHTFASEKISEVDSVQVEAKANTWTNILGLVFPYRRYFGNGG